MSVSAAFLVIRLTALTPCSAFTAATVRATWREVAEGPK
jgi:hypothetical protein